MTSPKQVGAIHNIVPSLALQEIITIGFAMLAQDEYAIGEVVRRVDELKRGTQDPWTLAMREEVRKLADPSEQQCAQVFIGDPAGIEHLPCVAISENGGNENTSEAVAGDEHHRFYELVRETSIDPPLPETVPDNESICIRHQVMGTGANTTLEASCWAVVPERAILLQSMVIWCVTNPTLKGRLKGAGVHDITWRTGGTRPAQQLEPRLGVLPNVTVTLSWTFRQTLREQVANRVTVRSGRFRT